MHAIPTVGRKKIPLEPRHVHVQCRVGGGKRRFFYGAGVTQRERRSERDKSRDSLIGQWRGDAKGGRRGGGWRDAWQQKRSQVL